MEDKLREARLKIFKAFLDDVILEDKENKGKIFEDYVKHDFERLSRIINRKLQKEDDDEKERKIAWQTFRDYKAIYNGEKTLKYSKYKLDILAYFIGYSSYRHYVEGKKVSLGFECYNAKDLIYGRKKSTYKSKKNYDAKENFENLSYETLSHLNDEQIKIYTQHFSIQVRSNPADDNAFFWLGVLLLKRKQYKSAIAYFTKSIEINPINSEYYYNLGLAMFKGKRPFRLKMDEITAILENLKTAIHLNSGKAKYYCLKYILNEDYFKRCGLGISGVTSKQLLKRVHELSGQSYELQRLKSSLGLSEEDYIELY